MLCCRVRSHDQKKHGDLDRQAVWLMQHIKDPVNPEIITDVGCGLNENRKGCLKLLDMVLNNEVFRVYVTYKDSLNRFAFWIQATGKGVCFSWNSHSGCACRRK